MKAGDLVRNKSTQQMGIIQWAHNTSSWWHRKKGLTAIAVLLTATGQTIWWKPKMIELICKKGNE
jgi:hypothetical protein